ncbi:hypothetical protein EHQ97_09400 [Leptospira adleri]|nr:hypothetical protein EHQ97_09400 [Leptospira adleri]
MLSSYFRRTYESTVKVAGPTLILGGGERWRENSGDFSLSQNSNFASKKARLSLSELLQRIPVTPEYRCFRLSSY